MDKIINWFKDKFGKEAQLNNDIKSISNYFKVSERNGKMYLVIGDIAFAEVDPKTTTKEVIALLNCAKRAAINYRTDE